MLNHNQLFRQICQISTAVFSDNNHILNSHTELIGQVNSRFNCDNHTVAQNFIAFRCHKRLFVYIKSHSVTRGVFKILTVTLTLDNLSRSLVNLYCKFHADSRLPRLRQLFLSYRCDNPRKLHRYRMSQNLLS